MKNNRRNFIKNSTSLAALISVGGLSAYSTTKPTGLTAPQKKAHWPLIEGPDTPKLTLNCSYDATPERMRMLKQVGVNYVLMDGPPRLPWTESGLRIIMDRFKREGLTVINMMIGGHGGAENHGFDNAIYGREGRDADIRNVQDSLRAAGAVGLPVVEYNFFAYRLIEGYYEVPGRGGAPYLAYDYNRVGSDWMFPSPRTASEATTAPKDLLPKPGIGAHTREMLWENFTYFLKAVIPVAEKAGVRMALHPNDPPAPVSRGSQQIMTTFNDFKRLVNIVDSPSNGMTFDCGVSNEIGENPLDVLDYLASHDRINHVHYRNCIVEIPSTKYIEVFPDNGTVDMFAVMQHLVRRKYRFGLWAEHPVALDYGKGHPNPEFAGQIYNQAYARAMFQAAISVENGNHII